MDLQGLFIYRKFFYFLIIFLLFTSLVDETHSVTSKINTCAPQNCGNGPYISYPFWIPYQQDPFCGSPGFNVTCNKNNYPVLSFSNDEYIIRDVFHVNNSILLEKADVFDENNSCPIPLNNFSIEGTPFSYGPAYSELVFLYNCSSPNNFETYSIDCASNGSHHAFAVFHAELLKYRNYSLDSCQSLVHAAADGDQLDVLMNMSYRDVLRKGFVLQWDAENCSNCERSGGNCGSYDQNFICYCSDKPHSQTCKDGHGHGLNIGRKVAIGLGASVVSIIFMVIIFVFYRRGLQKRYAASSLISHHTSSYSSSTTDLEKSANRLGVHIFNYNELEEATNNFDSSKELGDGGYGTVYQGKLRDGRVVAVKRLFENNRKRVDQFINEVEILTRLRHQNLVSLYGCTSRHGRELLLVYEFVPNGTVADHLHGERAQEGLLSWTTRMNIAIETASALAYLHASDVIHRDVKTTNILLDNNFCVKVADFGLSRLFPNDVTHVSTAPQGTPGYVDPEYHECYQLTDKSDVYSFGVVLVELISSMPAVDITRHRHEINLSNMAINKIQGHALHQLVDPSLGFSSDYKVKRMIAYVAELAFRCLQNGREMRPSMQEVLEALMGIKSTDYDAEKPQMVDVSTKDDVLLRSNLQVFSPDSVIGQWTSKSTTPSTSG